MRPPNFDLAKAECRDAANLDKVGHGHVGGATLIVRGSESVFVVKVVGVGRINRVNILEGKATAVEMTPMNAYTAARPRNVINSDVGIIESRIVGSPPVHPWVATSEHVIKKVGIGGTAICPSETPVKRESKTGDSRRMFRLAVCSKWRTTKPLGVVETGEKKLAVHRGGNCGFAPSE